MHSAQSVYSALLAFSLLAFFSPESVIIANAVAKVQINPVVIRELQRSANVGECPAVEERERARSEISQVVKAIIAASIMAPVQTTTITTGTTATSEPGITTSMTTNVDLTTTEVTTTTRDQDSVTTPPTLNGNACNGTPGWRRVAFINMTDTSYNCPTGLNLTSYSKRTCGRGMQLFASTTFSVGGLPYSQVCGRIRGYQFGATSAFFLSNRGIESSYVEGVSLTHGVAGNRQHIWTFAAGASEVYVPTYYPNAACPCDGGPNLVPSFVGNDYFCESGQNFEMQWSNTFHSDDVLWDGEDCTSNSTCCQFNNPPWFTKSLPSETTDDIELRIGRGYSGGNVPLELIELYVQ